MFGQNNSTNAGFVLSDVSSIFILKEEFTEDTKVFQFKIYLALYIRTFLKYSKYFFPSTSPFSQHTLELIIEV